MIILLAVAPKGTSLPNIFKAFHNNRKESEQSKRGRRRRGGPVAALLCAPPQLEAVITLWLHTKFPAQYLSTASGPVEVIYAFSISIPVKRDLQQQQQQQQPWVTSISKSFLESWVMLEPLGDVKHEWVMKLDME
ncbi:uncharacterized protein [Physcomitrium patens]|uniref:uncharacterized protein n=1 Tax=Physcomitrium patens TaxID=3218 RepID=UPI0001625E9D